MGTPDFAVPTLSELIAAGHDVVAVYSQPPRPAGRGMAERPSPVQAFAESAGLHVLNPTSFKGAAEREQFERHEADVAVVVAYGLLLPAAILNAPRHGCFNLHASALPRWRGAAPIQRAIMAGDETTAVMVMRMEEGLDTGPICTGNYIAITPDMTAGELHDELAVVGANLMVRTLAALQRGTLEMTAQPDEGITYASKIDKKEARIDFTRTAGEVHNLVRGLSPFPGAWFEATPANKPDAKPERIKVLRSELRSDAALEPDSQPGVILDGALTISCGSGAVRLLKVQRAGKKPADAKEFLRGFQLQRGQVLQPQ